MRGNVRLLLLIPLFYIIFACEVDSNCDSINRDFIVVSVVGLNANLEEVQNSIIVEEIRSPDAENTLFYANDTLSTFVLPLNKNSTELSYIIEQTSGDIDTLMLGYSLSFAIDEPEDCGVVFRIRDLEILNHSLDSVQLINDTINYINETPDLKLFFN